MDASPSSTPSPPAGSAADASATLLRRMSHPVPIGPQRLELDDALPALRLGIEAHRGTITLALPDEAMERVDLQWTQNGAPIPGQTEHRLTLGGLSVDDTDLFYATWVAPGRQTRRSQAALMVAYPGHRLANQSVRGWVDASHPLTAGFVVVHGTGVVRPKRYLVRVIGASLARFGVAAPLAQPVVGFSRRGNDCLRLLATESALVSESSRQVGAFALPEGATEFGGVAELPPGAYAITVSTVAEAGEALIEVYELPA